MQQQLKEQEIVDRINSNPETLIHLISYKSVTELDKETGIEISQIKFAKYTKELPQILQEIYKYDLQDFNTALKQIFKESDAKISVKKDDFIKFQDNFRKAILMLTDKDNYKDFLVAYKNKININYDVINEEDFKKWQKHLLQKLIEFNTDTQDYKNDHQAINEYLNGEFTPITFNITEADLKQMRESYFIMQINRTIVKPNRNDYVWEDDVFLKGAYKRYDDVNEYCASYKEYIKLVQQSIASVTNNNCAIPTEDFIKKHVSEKEFNHKQRERYSSKRNIKNISTFFDQISPYDDVNMLNNNNTSKKNQFLTPWEFTELKRRHLIQELLSNQNYDEDFTPFQQRYNKFKEKSQNDPLSQDPLTELEFKKYQKLYKTQQVLAAIPHYSDYKKFNAAAKNILKIDYNLINKDTFDLYRRDLKTLQRSKQINIIKQILYCLLGMINGPICFGIAALIYGAIIGLITNAIIPTIIAAVPIGMGIGLGIGIVVMLYIAIRNVISIYNDTMEELISTDKEIAEALSGNDNWKQLFNDPKDPKTEIAIYHLDELTLLSPRNINKKVLYKYPQQSNTDKNKPTSFTDKHPSKSNTPQTIELQHKNNQSNIEGAEPNQKDLYLEMLEAAKEKTQSPVKC